METGEYEGCGLSLVEWMIEGSERSGFTSGMNGGGSERSGFDDIMKDVDMCFLYFFEQYNTIRPHPHCFCELPTFFMSNISRSPDQS